MQKTILLIILIASISFSSQDSPMLKRGTAKGLPYSAKNHSRLDKWFERALKQYNKQLRIFEPKIVSSKNIRALELLENSKNASAKAKELSSKGDNKLAIEQLNNAMSLLREAHKVAVGETPHHEFEQLRHKYEILFKQIKKSLSQNENLNVQNQLDDSYNRYQKALEEFPKNPHKATAMLSSTLKQLLKIENLIQHIGQGNSSELQKKYSTYNKIKQNISKTITPELESILETSFVHYNKSKELEEKKLYVEAHFEIDNAIKIISKISFTQKSSHNSETIKKLLLTYEKRFSKIRALVTHSDAVAQLLQKSESSFNEATNLYSLRNYNGAYIHIKRAFKLLNHTLTQHKLEENSEPLSVQLKELEDKIVQSTQLISTSNNKQAKDIHQKGIAQFERAKQLVQQKKEKEALFTIKIARRLIAKAVTMINQ